MRGILLVSFAVLSLCAPGCGGAAEIGEKCDQSGSRDECVDGAICTNGTSGSFCRKVCAAQTDCSATEACNGVSGSSEKSCQPE
ncbi:MAG: hypothetical protein HY903_05055 [Deltaproteobacteria bacterium]|nr:hypothetical protein [Deltaproteobacteria bacterium]